MKKLVLVLIVLGVAAAIGYLVGTDGGRARKDAAVARVRKSTDGDVSAHSGLHETANDIAESGAELAEKVANKVGVTFN